LRLGGPLPLALVPSFVTVLLIWQAARGSNWETHDSGRAWLVAAVLINVAAVVTTFVVRDRGRAGWAIAFFALVVGIVAGLVGLVAISAN
jgi:uncharacterized membrane protein YecN with MAPEG domain